jgi:hypothetical protein
LAIFNGVKIYEKEKLEEIRTKIKHHFPDVRCGNIRDLDLVERNVWLALKGPESTTSDGVLFSQIDIVIRSGLGKVRKGDAHHFSRLVAGGD